MKIIFSWSLFKYTSGPEIESSFGRVQLSDFPKQLKSKSKNVFAFAVCVIWKQQFWKQPFKSTKWNFPWTAAYVKYAARCRRRGSPPRTHANDVSKHGVATVPTISTATTNLSNASYTICACSHFLLSLSISSSASATAAPFAQRCWR